MWFLCSWKIWLVPVGKFYVEAATLEQPGAADVVGAVEGVSRQVVAKSIRFALVLNPAVAALHVNF